MSSERERRVTPGSAGSGSGSRPPSSPIPGIPVAGDVIESKYLVEKVLGTGGMGVVLAARHTQIGQRVAIKFLHGPAAHDSNAVERFLREARAAVALQSEHVTKVLDVGTLDSGAPFMVMEYLAGIDLAEVLKRNGPMSVSDALSVVLQACEAIAEAHARGIVHRDLKPSNLFVAKHIDGTPLVKVLDFGISKMASFNAPDGENHTLTASGSVMGSPMYMSPEQVRNAKAVDGRSDIWAIGVILYEILTGHPPFDGATLGDTLARIIADPPTPMQEHRRDLPEGLAAVILQCLERRVDQRVQTIGELASKLQPFAPPEAALSLDRIGRMSRASSSNTMTAIPTSPGSLGEPRSLTQPSWHSSGTATAGTLRGPRRNWMLAGGAGATVLVIATVTLVALSRRGAEPKAPAVATAPAASSSSVRAAVTASPTPEEKPSAFASDTSRTPSASAGSEWAAIGAAVPPSASVEAAPRPSFHSKPAVIKPPATHPSAAPSAAGSSPTPAPPGEDLDPFSRLKHK